MPLNEMGYLNMPKENYTSMIRKAKTAGDVEVLKDAYFNFLGHRNLLPQTTLDKLMMKALEVQQPTLMFDFVKFHSELLYHPHPRVTQAYTEHFVEQGYDALKAWYEQAMRGRYMLQHPDGFH